MCSHSFAVFRFSLVVREVHSSINYFDLKLIWDVVIWCKIHAIALNFIYMMHFVGQSVLCTDCLLWGAQASLLCSVDNVLCSQFFQLSLGFAIAEATLCTNSDLSKLFYDCKDYIIATCQSPGWNEKVDDVCQVFTDLSGYNVILLEHDCACDGWKLLMDCF